MDTSYSKIRDDETYLDHIAASPVRDGVLEIMVPLLREGFGNPQSVHTRGQKAAEVLGKARVQVAALVGASASEVIFTSTGSEANNLVLKGVAFAFKDEKNHIVTTTIEHPSVLSTCRWLENHGFEVTYLDVNIHDDARHF